MQSKIFYKLRNLRKSTSKIQLSFISANNIGISTQYFANRTFTMILYLIGTCPPPPPPPPTLPNHLLSFFFFFFLI